MGKLKGDIAFLERNNKRRIGHGNKQETKLKRKKRKKDLKKLHRDAAGASKGSLTRIYRNGAKGKDIRKGNLPPSKFYKSRLQGEVAKLLNRETSKNLKDVRGSSLESIHDELDDKEMPAEEDSVSSEDDVQRSKRTSDKQSTSTRKFPSTAMFRYEEFCEVICSENFDDRSGILSELPDPIKKVRESLKRMHMNAMQRHFSRPDMNVNDYIINMKNGSSSNMMLPKNNSCATKTQLESCASPQTSDSLTANVVEDSYPATSKRNINEFLDKSQPSSSICFVTSDERYRPIKKTNLEGGKNFQLPCELFNRSNSTLTNVENDTTTSFTDFQRDDQVLLKNYLESIRDIEAKDGTSDVESEGFVKNMSKRNLSQHRAQTQKFIENLVQNYKPRRDIHNSINTGDTGVYTNLSERAMAWKATKNLKHVPAILRKSCCDLTRLAERKHNEDNLRSKLFRNHEVELSDCSSTSSNETTISVHLVKDKKCPKNQHRIVKEKSSSFVHKKVDFHVLPETTVREKTNRKSNKSTKHSSQKSSTLSKGALLNGDLSMHRSQSQAAIKSLNVDQNTTTVHPVHYQILHDAQPFLSNSERANQAEVTFRNPTRCTEHRQNTRDNNESKPVYFQIINQPLKPRTEQSVTNQSLINQPVATFTTCGQTLPNQTMMQQQPVVPVASQNLRFMLRESDPRVYAFSELQNLQLLTLNDSQNVYVSTLNSTHEQKRANECAIAQNVNQPTKYLAFEKDLNTHRIPIYFHNNDKTVSQQYLPCKMLTAVEKLNNDTVYYQEPTSQVILVQGSNLYDGNGQLIDPNFKQLV